MMTAAIEKPVNLIDAARIKAGLSYVFAANWGEISEIKEGSYRVTGIMIYNSRREDDFAPLARLSIEKQLNRITGSKYNLSIIEEKDAELLRRLKVKLEFNEAIREELIAPRQYYFAIQK